MPRTDPQKVVIELPKTPAATVIRRMKSRHQTVEAAIHKLIEEKRREAVGVPHR